MHGEGGEELIFRELAQRFPDKVATDRVGAVMTGNHEDKTPEVFTGRSRLVFTRLRQKSEIAVRCSRLHRFAWMPIRVPGSNNDHVGDTQKPRIF